MYDLHDLVRVLNSEGEEIEEAIGHLSATYQDKLCSWIKARSNGISACHLALIWTNTVHCLVEICRGAGLPEAWYCQAPLDDPVEYALRQCALDVLESPATSDVDALCEVGAVFSRTGFSWDALAQEDREELRACVRRVVNELDIEQKMVIQCFVRGYPDTRSLVNLRERLEEVESRQISIQRIAHLLNDVRRQLRMELQSVLSKVGVPR